MRLRIINPEHKISLWLPLFLLAPIFIVILLALLPLALLAAIVLLPFGWGKILLMVPAALAILCSARGLEVEVENKNNNERMLISVK
jgi:hypothetical protein